MSATAGKLKRIAIITAITLLLLLLFIVATVSTFLATETGSRFVVNFALEQASAIEGMSVEVGAIRGNLLQGLQLDAVEFDNAGLDVDVVNIRANWNPSSLFTGRVLVRDITVTGPTVVLKEVEEPPGEGPGLDEFSFSPLPVAISVNSLNVRNLQIQQAGQTYTVDNFSAAVQLIGNDLTVRNLSLAAMDATASGRLALELGPNLPLEADLDWGYEGQLPLDYSQAAGELSIDGDLQSLNIEHQLNSPVTLHSIGSASQLSNPDLLEIDLVHSSDSVEIPLAAMPIRVEDFNFVTSGSLENLRLELNSMVHAGEYPKLDVAALALLSGTTLALERFNANTPSGEVALSGVLDFANGLVAEASFDITEQQPLAYIEAELPVTIETLSANGGLRLQIDDSTQRYSLNLAALDARVNDYQLAANGDVALENDRLLIEELMVQTDDNRLTVSGNYEENVDITWQISAPQLQQFLPGFSGNVTGSGVVRGDPLRPEIDASLNVAGLESELFDLETAALEIDGDGSNYSLVLDLSNASIGAGSLQRINSARVTASGNEENQELNIDVNADSGSLVVDLQGGFTDLENLAWAGQLTAANLEGIAGSWELTDAVALAWSDNQLTVDNGCWAYDVTRLCFAVQPQPNQGYALTGRLSDFPLDEFNASREGGHLIMVSQLPRLPEEVGIVGRFSADLEASFGPEIEPSFRFVGAAEDTALTVRTLIADDFGAVTSEAEEIEQTYAWQGLSMSGALDQGAWSFEAAAELDRRTVQDDEIELDGNLRLNGGLAADGTLNGNASASFQDLGWVSAFLPDVSAITGNLSSSINLAGTLDAPEVTGRLSLDEGSFFFENTGVTFNEIELMLLSETMGSVTLEGGLSAGEGRLSFNGEASSMTTADWRIGSQIQGDNFLLASIPNLELAISPDLNVNASSRQIEVSGDLLIPILDLILEALPASAVDISRDVVIVNYPEERPELARSFTTGQTAVFDIPLVLDLQVTLGDEVRFAGFGLETELDGSLSIEQFASGRNLTYGDLQITEGVFKLYGQTLTLQQGEILFLGNYNNPALDVRAVREVENMTVGVHISGTVRNMRSELFSSPVLPESDVISVLVTGRPVSQLRSGEGANVMDAITTLGLRQGNALGEQIGTRLGLDSVAITNSGDLDSSALVLGKYLSPDLFVRYGIGLFDRLSKVGVDYSINDRLKLQAESGEYQSVDLTYRVESER